MRKMCVLFLFGLFFISIANAEQKPFAYYIYPDSKILAPCGNAKNIEGAVSPNTACEIWTKVFLPQRQGANLATLSRIKNYHPIYIWVEKRVGNPYEPNWERISNIKKIRYNNVYESLKFTLDESAIVRVALDYQGQRAFSDSVSDEFKILVR